MYHNLIFNKFQLQKSKESICFWLSDSSRWIFTYMYWITSFSNAQSLSSWNKIQWYCYSLQTIRFPRKPCLLHKIQTRNWLLQILRMLEIHEFCQRNINAGILIIYLTARWSFQTHAVFTNFKFSFCELQ